MAEITIIGTGAMALFFGGRLARSGVKVRFLGTWEECIDAINQNGICILEEDSPRYYPAKAYTNPIELKGTRLALVLVKSWQTERAARHLGEILSDDGVALTMQNGIGNWEMLSKELGMERTAQGVTTCGATLMGPGIVQPGGEGKISVQEHSRLPEMTALFQEADFDVKSVPDLSGLVWGKLIINVAINPLTGLFGVKNGRLLDSPAATRLMGLAAKEAEEVAAKMGIPVNQPDPGQAAEEVAAMTRNNKSSMLQDIQRGAPTEIDALCGAVVSQGKRLGVATPVNQMLTLLIKAKLDLKGIEE